MKDFDAFLQDHANCERKASAMAMSFVAKYPDRTEIIPELIDTGIEELEHFRDVYEIMKARHVPLPQEIGQDDYVKQLLDSCRSGRVERFMDRLLLASDGVSEARSVEGAMLGLEPISEITSTTNADSGTVIELLKKKLVQHRGMRRADDDVTMLCVDRLQHAATEAAS